MRSEIEESVARGFEFDAFLFILFVAVVVFFVKKFIYLTHLKSKRKFKNIKDSLSSGKHAEDDD